MLENLSELLSGQEFGLFELVFGQVQIVVCHLATQSFDFTPPAPVPDLEFPLPGVSESCFGFHYLLTPFVEVFGCNLP